MDLMFNSEKNKYFWLGKDICQKCNKPIINFGFLLWDYYKVNFKQYIYCFECRSEIKKASGKYSEFKKVFIISSDLLPNNSFGIFPDKPFLSNARNLDVFDVATKNIYGEQVIDKAIQSININFMIDHKAKDIKKIEEYINSERLISSDILKKEFSFIKSSKLLSSRFEEEDDNKEVSL